MPPLRVAFQVGSRLGGGMARYAQELGKALAARDDIEIVPIGTAAVLDALHDSLGAPGDRIVVPATQLGEAAAMRYRLSRWVAGRADIVHGTKHLVPWRSPVPTVLTVQDVLLLDEPGGFLALKRFLLPRQYRHSLREASVVIVASHATGERLGRHLPDVQRRAVVLPTVTTSAVLLAVPRALANAPDAFGLYVGDLSPRKNVAFLLDVWDEVYARTGVPLLMVGPDGWMAEPVLRALPDFERRGVVRRLGFVDDGTLRWLYERAAVVALPSTYEGTGLPVVEALALGSPVIASEEPALVEYSAGRATHLPFDQDAWVTALAQAVTAKSPDRRLPAPDASSTAAWAERQVEIYREALGAIAR